MRDELRPSIDVGASFCAQKCAGTSGSARSVMEADLPARVEYNTASEAWSLFPFGKDWLVLAWERRAPQS